MGAVGGAHGLGRCSSGPSLTRVRSKWRADPGRCLSTIKGLNPWPGKLLIVVTSFSVAVNDWCYGSRSNLRLTCCYYMILEFHKICKSVKRWIQSRTAFSWLLENTPWQSHCIKLIRSDSIRSKYGRMCYLHDCLLRGHPPLLVGHPPLCSAVQPPQHGD